MGVVLMPMSELSIEDTWFVAGMKGTGSNTVVAEDVFVPEHRYMSMTAAFQGIYADRAHRRGALPRGVHAGRGAHPRAARCSASAAPR